MWLPAGEGSEPRGQWINLGDALEGGLEDCRWGGDAQELLVLMHP